jgi:hypothetical protein
MAQAFTARLRGRRELPPAGAELKISYLTHLEVAAGDDDALRRLVLGALSKLRGHALALLQQGHGPALSGLGARRLPVRLLAVAPDGVPPDLPAAPLGIEMALA